MIDVLIERAQLLLQQQRYKEAEVLINQVLQQDANNFFGLLFLTEIKIQQEKSTEALEIINTAIGCYPDVDVLFRSQARCYMMASNYLKAQESLEQAITLDASNADSYALLAHVYFIRKNYETALSTANEALALEPENLLALNTRSSALTKLNRTQESNQTIEHVLNEDPNNAYTHANVGWNLLEHGDHQKALYHFTEALKNNPTLEHAQSGMMEALKARYFLYRKFLQFSFWLNNLTSKNQWLFIIGMLMGNRILRMAAEKFPALSPFVLPIVILIALFAFSTWIITPLSNLFLRFNKYGNYLLSKNEKLSSLFVAISLAIAVFGGITWFITNNENYVLVLIFGIAMMIPLAGVLSETRMKYLLPIYTSVLFLIGVFMIWCGFNASPLQDTVLTAFAFGVLGYQFLYNYIHIKQSNF